MFLPIIISISQSISQLLLFKILNWQNYDQFDKSHENIEKFDP